MRDLPLELAERIAKEEYWDVLNLDAVAAVADFEVAYELMDSAYHAGPQKAGRWLQDWLNALNLKQKLYPDMIVDSKIGDNTLRALHRYVAHRRREGIEVLLRGLNSSQGAFYLDLSQRREKDEEFLYGWMLQRVVI
jgi:lysozyme family protein